MNGAKLRNKNRAEATDANNSDTQHIVHEGNMHSNAAGINRNNEYPYTQ